MILRGYVLKNQQQAATRKIGTANRVAMFIRGIAMLLSIFSGFSPTFVEAEGEVEWSTRINSILG